MDDLASSAEFTEAISNVEYSDCVICFYIYSTLTKLISVFIHIAQVTFSNLALGPGFSGHYWRYVAIAFQSSTIVIRCCLSVVCRLSVWLYCDKTTVNRITRFSHKAAKVSSVSTVSLKTKFEGVPSIGAQPILWWFTTLRYCYCTLHTCI